MGLLSNARMNSIDFSMLGVMDAVPSRLSTHSLGWVPRLACRTLLSQPRVRENFSASSTLISA